MHKTSISKKDLKPIFLWIYQTMRLERNINAIPLPQSDEERSNYVADMLQNELATVFLLVWPIMEQKLFDGTATNSKEKDNNFWNFSKRNRTLFDGSRMNEAAKYFHKRYKENDKYYQNLLAEPHKVRGNSPFDNILKKNYYGSKGLHDHEKLYLLLFVTYRYRNNIFHGNKEINAWKDYSKEMAYCIDFMIALIDAYMNAHPEQPCEMQLETQK